MQRAAGHVLASRRYASEPRQQRGALPSPPPPGEGWEGGTRLCEKYWSWCWNSVRPTPERCASGHPAFPIYGQR